MSYRDVRLSLAKASELIAILGIKRSEVDNVSVHGILCLSPTIRVTAECFVRLCRVHKIVPTIKREGEFLSGDFRYRGFAITVVVWEKSSEPNTLEHWRVINAYSQPMLEAKRTAIGVKRPAIADKRRLIGLPAPAVIDV